MTKKSLYFQVLWHLSSSSLSFFSSFTPSQAQWLLCCSQNMLAILLSHNFWLAVSISEMLFLKIFLNSFLHFLHFYSNVFLSGLLGLTNVKWTSVQFSRVQLFVTPWTFTHQASCPSPTPGVHPNPCPLSRWCHPTISSSVVPFSSCLQSFPASGSQEHSFPHFLLPTIISSAPYLVLSFP